MKGSQASRPDGRRVRSLDTLGGTMDERMAGGGGAQDLAAYADHEKTAIGVYAGLIVKRDRLLHDLAMHGRDLGISVVSGPRGFGVTALLRQYVSVVQSDPARGAAAYIDAARLDEAGVVGAMESACDAMPAGTRASACRRPPSSLRSGCVGTCRIRPQGITGTRYRGSRGVYSHRPTVHAGHGGCA